MTKVDNDNDGAVNQTSMIQMMIALVVLTLVGGGGGGFLGYSLSAPPPAGQPAEPAPGIVESAHGEAHADPHKKGGGHGEAAKKAVIPVNFQVRELPPIVTNLAHPESSWIRLQAAIVFDPAQLQHPEKLIVELTADVTAFLRTASIASLEGSDGLRRLQEELGERAAIRSERKIREFIIETMVVQ